MAKAKVAKQAHTKFDARKILKAARYSRQCWLRALEGAKNLHEAREHLRMAEAAGETRSREYKEAESALLNLVRGEIMSSFDERGPQRVPSGREIMAQRQVSSGNWNTVRAR